MFGLYLHSSLVPCDFLLVLQWSAATIFFMVGHQFNLCGCDVCGWRISMYEDWVKSYTCYKSPKSWFMMKISNDFKKFLTIRMVMAMISWGSFVPGKCNCFEKKVTHKIFKSCITFFCRWNLAKCWNCSQFGIWTWTFNMGMGWRVKKLPASLLFCHNILHFKMDCTWFSWYCCYNTEVNI